MVKMIPKGNAMNISFVDISAYANQVLGSLPIFEVGKYDLEIGKYWKSTLFKYPPKWTNPDQNKTDKAVA